MGLKRNMMKKMMPKEFGAISGLFHAGTFALQSTASKTLGKSVLKDSVFPAMKKAVDRIEELGIKPVAGENIEEFGKRFIEVLKKSMLVASAFLGKNSENEYIFTLYDCFMAGPAHRLAGVKGVCPMAMAMAAMIEKYLGKTVEPEFSILTPNGSVTKIKIS